MKIKGYPTEKSYKFLQKIMTAFSEEHYCIIELHASSKVKTYDDKSSWQTYQNMFLMDNDSLSE